MILGGRKTTKVVVRRSSPAVSEKSTVVSIVRRRQVATLTLRDARELPAVLLLPHARHYESAAVAVDDVSAHRREVSCGRRALGGVAVDRTFGLTFVGIQPRDEGLGNAFRETLESSVSREREGIRERARKSWRKLTPQGLRFPRNVRPIGRLVGALKGRESKRRICEKSAKTDRKSEP